MRSKFPSRKNGRLVHCEGLLELEAAHLFEVSSRVASYREQPERVPFPFEGQLRHWVPDLELTLCTGELVLVEVKPSDKLKTEAVADRLAAIATQMHRRGRTFVVLDDTNLRVEPRQTSVRRLLWEAPRTAPTAAAAQAALGTCAAQLPASAATLAALLEPRGISPISLLLMGLLRFDLAEPFSPNTLLHSNEDSNHAWLQLREELSI